MSGPESVEGLITRFGRWLDRRFQAKATQTDLRYFWNQLENASIKDKVEVMERIDQVKVETRAALMELRSLVQDLQGKMQICFRQIETLELIQIPDIKEISELKTRMEKMELYAGMTRKVDPTKPPIVKSAFQM